MKRLFVDSGAWIALIRADDRNHGAARGHFEMLRGQRTPLLTTNYVVDETATFLRNRSGLPSALAFRQMLIALKDGDQLALAWIDEQLENEGWGAMERYADVRLSMTDATSAAVARRNKIADVFGFDNDFRAMGFSLQPSV